MWKIKRESPDKTPAQAENDAEEQVADVLLHPVATQRDETLLEIKMAIHQGLLEKINLSLLDKLPVEQIRSEMSGLVPELLASFD